LTLYRWERLFRISSNSTLTNKHFFTWELPPVADCLYRDFSERVPQALGAETRQGYKNVTLFWEQMTYLQGFTLRTILEEVTAGNELYLTIPRANGEGGYYDFIDVSGYYTMPDWDFPPRARGLIYQGVELKVNNLTIVNDPSDVL